MSNIQGVDSAMALLQEHALTNQIDYQYVMQCLKEYGSPRAKLTRLIESEAIIHIRKGLYLLGPKFKLTPYCFEILANLIYGPSYVSLEWALQMYGLIPEHVEMITSVTSKIGKEFKTPIGIFSYSHTHSKAYFVGVTTKKVTEYENPLIATPEKALIDMLIIRRGKMTSLKELEQVLLEDLRIEESDLLAFDMKQVSKIVQAFPHSAARFFEKWLAGRKRRSHE